MHFGAQIEDLSKKILDWSMGITKDWIFQRDCDNWQWIRPFLDLEMK